MTDIKKEFENLGDVLAFYKTNEMIEIKVKLHEDTTKPMIDAYCVEFIESIYPVLISFDIQGRYFKCSYTISL